jgi:hypothetical protein
VPVLAPAARRPHRKKCALPLLQHETTEWTTKHLHATASLAIRE